MKIKFDGINATMTESQISEICDRVEKSLKQQHGERWNKIINDAIIEKAALAGRTSDERTEEDICHGMAYEYPTVAKEYTKYFIKQALIEIFCDNEKSK